MRPGRATQEALRRALAHEGPRQAASGGGATSPPGARQPGPGAGTAARVQCFGSAVFGSGILHPAGCPGPPARWEPGDMAAALLDPAKVSGQGSALPLLC